MEIRGITVTLIASVDTGRRTPGNRPIMEEHREEVHDVLVSPVSAEDMTWATNLSGRKAAYTLAIPKGDTHAWTGQAVEFFGQRWRVVGVPLQGIEALIPLRWNKKVTVEAYEQG